MSVKIAIKMSFFNNLFVIYKQESYYRILCWTLKLVSYGGDLAKIDNSNFYQKNYNHSNIFEAVHTYFFKNLHLGNPDPHFFKNQCLSKHNYMNLLCDQFRTIQLLINTVTSPNILNISNVMTIVGTLYQFDLL